VTPPDSEPPTSFPPASRAGCHQSYHRRGTESVQVGTPPPEITKAIESLSVLVRNIFIVPQAVYINQAAYNIKDAEHSCIANKSKLVKTAEATELLCATEVQVPSKIVKAALDQKVLASKSALKKEVDVSMQSIGDKLPARMNTLEELASQDRAKRTELEAEIALLKSSKEERGPAMGALQRNQNGVAMLPTVHFDTESPPANQPHKRRRSKSQLKQPQNQVQADDANQGTHRLQTLYVSFL
jgi:hypothetical protein